MWNARPSDPDRPDPFGRNPAKSGEGAFVGESDKCPSCGSNIFYRPEVQGMVCRNCGNIYHPSTLEKMGSLGYSIEHDYTGDNEISEDDKKRHEIVCDSCGAVMIADENMMSTMCAFCGSPALITRRMTREFKPDYIVPFKIDKETAVNNMKQWLETRKMTPKGFKTKSRFTKMMPVYVPFWLLDCAVNNDMYGTGIIHTGDKPILKPLRANAKFYVKGVPFDASIKIANKLMEAIEPFDYSEMVKFDNRYLQGFYADKYDQTPMDMMDRFIKRLNMMSMDMNGTIAAKFDDYDPSPEKNFVWMNEVSIKYCLLPVWFMTVEFDGSTYQFAVNGQTGEASGQAPTTEAVDKLDSLVRFSNCKWKKVAGIAVAVLPVFLAFIAFSGTASRFWYYVFLTLSFIEIALVAFLIVLAVIRKIGGRTSHKIHETVDVVNDFDKAPGMDSYLDTTHKTELKVEDYRFHQDLEFEDKKKRKD